MPGYQDFAYSYDRLTENVDYDRIAETIVRLLQNGGLEGGILLDLACGTGSLSFLLSEKGYDVIGADSSEEMLCIAQEKRAEKNADIIFLCQKMQELDLFGTIDAAVCTLDSINHVTDENTVKRIFERVSLFMNDGGMFIFDVNTPYKHKNILADNTFVYDLDDVFCVWQNTYNDSDCSVEVFLDIFELDGESGAYERYSEQFAERAYDIEKLKSWLSQYRFEVTAVLDAETEGELRENSERALFVCRKHGTQLR